MPLNYDSLPAQVLALLQAGRVVTVRWNCGSDESLVTIQFDGVQQDFDLGEDYHYWMFAEPDEYETYLARITNLPVLLGDFLAARLGLPSIGDFAMQGGGYIFLEGEAIWLEYKSDATSYVDNPDDWLPEEYLSAAELAELCLERLQPDAPDPAQMLSLPDPELAAAYTGREILFSL